MLFAIMAFDKDEGGAIRATTRQAHLDYLASAGDRLKLAGPLRGEDDKPVGSLIVLDAAGIEAVRIFAHNDPYAQAGLFRRVEIHPFKAILGSWSESERAE